MQELAALASIVATLTVGVVSPGPSFVMVARVAFASSRSRALATALGMSAGAKRPLAIVAGSGQGSSRPLRSFWLGVTTQVSNPKTAIVYASVFAAFLPASFSLGFAAVLLAAVFLVESAWYALVAFLFSSTGPQRAYLSYKSWIDRAAGAAMLGLGLKLVTSAAKP